MILEILLALAAGLLIGSFLNVCIYRLPRDLSVVRPRSYCPDCKHPIAWFDNIPLLSYALLGRRCRHCRERIPLRYPVVELLTALSFASAIALDGVTPAGAKLALFSALLIGLLFADVEERILPDEFTLGGAAAGVLAAYFVHMPAGLAYVFLPASWGRPWHSVGEALLGALVPSLTLWLVGELYYRVRKREGLGLGDVKMIAMIGAFLGLSAGVLALIAGSMLGAVTGLLFILITRKDAATYELPFGTFLGATALYISHFGAAWPSYPRLPGG